MELCVFCGTQLIDSGPGEIAYQNCKVCGEYFITIQARILFKGSGFYKDRHKISSFLRERSILHTPTKVFLHWEEASKVKNAICYEDIIKQFPRKINERLNKALLNVSRLTSYMGEFVPLSQWDYPVFYPDSTDVNACFFIMNQLYLEDLIENKNGDKAPGFPTEIRLTPKGWSRIAELETATVAESNEVFVAMWFDEAVVDVYRKAIAKAIEDTGFVPIRVDFEEYNEKICDRIIADIKKSRFVICDFTGHRGGVYFEAGYAMGLGKPVIWTCREDEIGKIHFDTRQYNHVTWQDADELYEKLKRRIEATIL